MSAEKQKLFEYLLEEAGVEPLQIQIIPPKRPTDLPLSFAQHRLWLLDQLEPGNLAYTIFAAVRLAGLLDVAALARSLDTIVQRHEILRTTFTLVNDQPVQRIAFATTRALPLVDLRALPEAEQEAEIERLIAAETQRPFDLALGPLLRTSLVRLSEDRHVLLMAMHHIISDGWSMGIFVRETAALYEAFSTGKLAPLPALPIQYADFALWQREWLRGELLERQLAYWRAQLDMASPLLDLPSDRPRPALQTFRGATHRFVLPEALAGLRALGRQESATLFMTLLAAFQALLYRYSGQADISVGTPIANRVRKETEHLIGFFVNSLVLRSDLSGDPTFVELLGRVREAALGAYAHQDLPFEQLVAELRPERVPSHAPLFQVMFALQNAPLPSLEFAGLRLSPMTVDGAAAKFDLTLIMEEAEQGLLGALEYNSDLFDEATIVRMAGHFQALLAGICAAPGQRVAELPLLTAPERRQLLLEWGIPQEVPAQDICIHQLFEAQAARLPDAIALQTTTDQRPTTNEADLAFSPQSSAFSLQMTYGELNRRANQLAHYLRGLGVGPETLVGIRMERSVEMVIGILGILKAGAAYLPLDPAYPPERLAFMLADSQAKVLITTNDQRPATSDDEADPSLVAGRSSLVETVDLARDWPDIARGPETNPESGVTAANLAYVIYTSGSTGTPKGSSLPHANLVRLFDATQAWLQVDERDVWTLFHSYAFDFSVWEIWGALRYGGRLVVVPYWASRSPAAFYELVCRNGVTVLNQTPSAFRLFERAEQAARAAGRLRLRLVIFGGEALEVQSLRPWFERHGDRRPQLVNMYGITETTVHVTYRPLTLTDLDTPSRSPIGEAIPDLGVAILDSQMQLVPIGVPGELYVGGAGLARGYLNRPELTAERFVPNPFTTTDDRRPTTKDERAATDGGRWSVAGRRLYRTGDLARRLLDGDIEYMGRIDQQVKIRGFRIELGEIAASLAQHPAIRNAVVLAREDTPRDRRLVAYVVLATDDRRPTADDEGSDAVVGGRWSVVAALRSFLAERLPDYMLPAAFVMLDVLPLTANGKVDLRALPAPDIARLQPDKDMVLPRTPVERALADVWARVLGVEQVGVHDLFFDLGGDSIRGIQLVAQAQQRGLHFSLRQLFQHQTISGLARELDQRAGEERETSQVEPFSLLARADRERLPLGIEDAYPLSMLQLGMLFHSVYSSDSAVYHNITSLHLQAPFDAEKLQLAIQQLAERHPMLRTSFDLSQFSEPLQLVHRAVRIPVEIEDLSGLTPAQQAAALAAWFEAQQAQRFDWALPPLLRFAIHRRSPQSFQLSWCEHHAILDGWSVASLITELCQHYLLLLGAAEHPLAAAPSLTYAAFVALERQAIASEASRQYWLAKLRDSPQTALPRWPFAQAERGARTVRIASVPVAADVAEGLRQLAQAAGVPLKSALLAAHLRVLRLLSGQADILTGLVTNGRPEAADGERILGLFLNSVPLRLNLSGGTWIDLARAAFAAERELLPFRRYPLAQAQKLVERQPLFETLFNFVHFHVYQRVAGLAGIQVLEQQSFQETNFTFVANFSVDPSLSQVQLRLEADATQFGDEQLGAIGEHYAAALAAMARAPDRRYEADDLLPAWERDRLLIEWNAPGASHQPSAISHQQPPADVFIHELIAAQAARTPDAVALQTMNDEDRTMNGLDSAFSVQRSAFSVQMTYGELDRRANQLAHHLRALGVGPEVLVGVCIERSLELVVGILGILKAGGAYLPLDPSYPPERLAFMLEDSQAAVLLTTTDGRPPTNDQRPGLSSLVGRRSSLVEVDLARDWPIIARARVHAPDVPLSPDDLAYVIYTSGSTGRPKGVAVAHRNLVHSIGARYAYYREPVAGFLLLSSAAFDSSVAGIFWTLCQGGMLLLTEPGRARDPQYLVDTLRQGQVSHLLSVPSLYSLLLAQAESQPLGRLRAAIVAGEPCSASVIDRHRALLPQTQLFNEYGPTEATVWSTVYDCRAERLSAQVPIGRPIANAQIYILNAALQPVPIGSVGELYIGGEGVARGYLGRPELTAERFVPNPFGTLNDERRTMNEATLASSFILHPSSFRLYRTGDLARYLPNGDIEFLGRIDHQVKIRGFRIEPGEIEALLGQHPAVREAFVLAREDAPGEKRLVAYVIPTNDQRPTTNEVQADDSSLVVGRSSFVAELRSFLATRLPDYMIPATFMVLNNVPLTPNGKVDRRALPAPEPARPEIAAPYVAPETELDQAIARIWRELLRIERVGIHDNFFELGGDSLLLVQLHSRLRDALQCDLAMVDLFRYPTISALSTYLGRERREHAPLQESYERAETRRASMLRRRRSANG